MKAAYAIGFLGLCAMVLIVHNTYDTSEEVKEVQDPFLASLEAHVVARAQKALRQREAHEASENHISEARKAIKASLMDAESSAIHQIRQAKAKQLATTQVKGKVKSKAADPEKKKTFTWAELQRGEDAVKETVTENKVGNLLNKLKKAPLSANQKPKQVAKKKSVLGKALKNAKQASLVQDNHKASKQKSEATDEDEDDDEEDDFIDF
jgi:hypothetical protein